MSPPEAKRGRGRPRIIDREHAIQQALLAWWEAGVDGVSLNQITRTTGLSKSSLYREFGGADGLMAAALARYDALAVAPLLDLFASDQRPHDVLALAIAQTTTPRALPAGCFFTKLRTAPGRVGEQTRAGVEAMVQTRRHAFATWFERAQREGDADPNMSPVDAAFYLDTQLMTMLVLLGAGEPVDAVRRQARTAMSVLLIHPIVAENP